MAEQTVSPSPKGRTSGIAVLVGGRFAWLLLQVVALAIYFRVLGAEAYGVAVAVSLYRGLMKLLDLEIPSGSLQRLSVAFRGDEARAWRLFGTTLGLQSLVALVGAALLVFGPVLAPLSSETKMYPALGAMFAFAAVQHVTDTFSSTLTIPFMARERFRQLAIFDSYLPMVFTVLMVGGVLFFRTPLALTIGTAAESLAGLLVKVVLYRRTESLAVLRPRLEPALAHEIFNVGWRVYLTNLSSKIGSTADKLIIEHVLGSAAVGLYNAAVRIPQVMLETFTRMSEAITPNMTAVAAHEPRAFSELLRRNALVVATVSATGIVAIGGLGTPLIQAWIKSSDPTAGLIVLLMALYYGLEQHFSTYTRGFFAQNKIAWMLPFTIWNTTITLLLTGPLARHVGLGGVAAMNLGIDLLQIVPITYVTVRVIAPDLAFRPLLLRSTMILGTGFVVAVLFFMLSRGTPIGIA
ncbi:lipopolysaccharide biosynthesis protein, partial [bacterium]